VGSKIKGFDTFAKTGTTSDSQDLWFVGGTPHYVAACWYGFDNPKKHSPNGMDSLYGYNSGAAMNLWKEVMAPVHENLPEKEFEDSEYAEKLKYCTKTGLIASKNCKKATGWYRAENIPETCTKCKGSSKDKDKEKEKEKEEDSDSKEKEEEETQEETEEPQEEAEE